MWNIPKVYRVVVGSLSAGASFAAYALVEDLASPLRILVGSLAITALFAVMFSRQSRGKTPMPTWFLILFSVGALSLYSWALLVLERPVGAEWLWIVVIFFFPAAMLIQAYRQWHGHA